MRKSVKKALSFFMAVAVMLSCITITPVSVSASEYEIGALVDSGNCGVSGNDASVQWELTKNGTNDQGEDTYTITIKGNGAMYDYTPDINNPKWVKNYRNNITKIVIGYGITRIGVGSFYSCIKAEEVVFEKNEKGESSVTSIGKNAFRNSNELKGIAIPASMQEIGDVAFKGCTVLTSLVFEESSSFTTIGVQAFYGAISLEECIIPSKVTTIGDSAFRGNTALKRFYYPSIIKINKFGSEVFKNDNSLDYLGRYTVNETAKTCSVEYIGLNKDTCLPADTIVPTASEIIIPEKLDGYEVVQATISDNTVDIPKSFEADHEIAKLSDIEALEGWTYEAETDELPLGGSVEVTATYKVGETQKLTKKITVSRAACADINKDHKCDGGCDKTFGECVDVNKDHKCDYGCDKNIGECVDANKDHKCDYGCDKNMGDCVDANKDHKCDYGCDKNMGECVDANKDHKCDYGCSKVTAHTWDTGVVTKKATATAKGEKTYTCTFCKATKKEEIAALGLPKKGSKYTSDDGKAKYKITKSDAKKGTVSFVAPANKKATTVTIPSTVKIKGVTFKVTAIEKNAFKNNKKVKNVTIGKNVTTIGKKAFYGCSKLKKLTIKSSKLTEKKIGSKAFSKTPKSMKVTLPKKKFKTYKSMLTKKGVNKKAKFVKG